MSNINQSGKEFLDNLAKAGGNDKIVLCFFGEKGRKFLEYNGELNLNENYNIYYTFNPRNGEKVYSNGQGTKKDVRRAIGFFCDIDCGSEGHTNKSDYESKEEALKIINEKAFLEPSYIIDSGHGFHVIWLFKKYLQVGSEISINEYEDINGRIQKLFGADYTKDISRILRLPGSMNVKNPERPVRAEIVKQTENKYEYKDFLDALYLLKKSVKKDKTTEIEPKTCSQISSSLLEAITSRLEKKTYSRKFPGLTRRIIRIIKEGFDTLNPGKTDRSCLVQSAVGSMISENYEYGEIYSILTDKRNKISEKINEFPSEESRKKYVARSIAKGEQYVGKHNDKENFVDQPLSNRIEGYFKGFHVLGCTDEDDCYIMKNGVLKTYNINKITKYNFALLCNLDEVSNELYKEMMKVLLHKLNKRETVDSSERIRNGIYRFEGSFYLVSGMDIIEITPENEMITHKEPMIGNKIVDTSRDEKWLDVECFKEIYHRADIVNVYSELYDHVDQWNWKEPEMVAYMTALMIITPFHIHMDWRPWVYIMGRRGHGKSFFFKEALEGFFGNLAKRMDKTTRYALSKEINNSGLIPMLDDFEKDKRNESLLNTIKISNQGGTINLGQHGKENVIFRLNHMYYFNSILNSETDAAEKSRTIFFRMLKSAGNEFKYKSEKEFNKLLMEAIAAVIKSWDKIEKRAREIKESSSKREIHNVAYVVAVLELVSGKQIEEYPDFIFTSNESEDEIKLLRTILDTITKVDSNEEGKYYHYEEKTAIKILKEDKKALKDKGLEVAKDRKKGIECLVIGINRVKRNLLQNTEYRDLPIKDYLVNLPEAYLKQHAEFGNNTIYYPWDKVLELFPDNQDDSQ